MSKNNLNQSRRVSKVSYRELYLAHRGTTRRDPFLGMGLANLTIPPPKNPSFDTQCHKSPPLITYETQSIEDRFNWEAKD
tara:strand:- start:129 stop:368 length:240 start_codon:yes stop_codon:yes gene_type:complete